MTNARRSPLMIQELLELTQVGIRPENINSGDLTMESDKYICVRKRVEEKDELVILDMSKPTHPLIEQLDFTYYGSTNYDAIIINPASRVLSGRVGNILQILKSETGTTSWNEFKEHTMKENVEFWKWINNDTIAVVTKAAVYHWSMEGDSEPVKVFDRHWPAEIKDYLTDHSLKWLVLIYSLYESDRNLLQLYSVDSKFSRFYEDGYQAAFTEFKSEHNSEPSLLLCYSSNSSDLDHLHIIEVGLPAQGNQPYLEKVVERFASSSSSRTRSIHISQKFNIIYVITNSGDVHLYDVESGDFICNDRRSIGEPLATVPHVATGGIVVVNAEGQVLTISFEEEKIIYHIITTEKNYELAKSLASRWNVTGPDEILNRQFNAYYDNAQYVEAAKFAADSCDEILRTPHIIKKLQLASTDANQSSPILRLYFEYLITGRTKLNEFESLELCRRFVYRSAGTRKDLLDRLFYDSD